MIIKKVLRLMLMTVFIAGMAGIANAAGTAADDPAGACCSTQAPSEQMTAPDAAPNAATTYVEDFPDPLGGWTSRWFYTNTNAESYYVASPSYGCDPDYRGSQLDGIWISDDRGCDNLNTPSPVLIKFYNNFGDNATSFSLDQFTCVEGVTFNVYDKDGVLDTATRLPSACWTWTNYSYPLTNGISAFEYVQTTGALIEGNTSIDNVTLVVQDGGAIDAKLEWAWNSPAVEPDYNQVMMAPVAADLDGDNIPEVIFSTFSRAGGWQGGGILRAIHGNGGGAYFSVTDPTYRVQAGADPAVADIDNDGKPEIVVTKDTGEVICFEHDGTHKWTSAVAPGRKAVAIADIDNDGTPEIIVGRTVLNNDGTERWTGTGASSYSTTVADLDLDGLPEVIAGTTAYRNDGTVFWTVSGSTHPGVANFDRDGFPEVVLTGGGNVSLWEHDGTPIWGPIALPGGGTGGPPMVADVDGDGLPEIGVAEYDRYVLFESDGTIKWTANTQDFSSRVTSSTAFDFDGDGSYEIVYSDELMLRIFRGSDGTVLFETPAPSGTLFEHPIILDVDNDGYAEIVSPLNNYARPGNTGIEVYGNDRVWPAARGIWNQHTYHVTNIHDDATVPISETNNWDVFNNFRAQSYQGIGTGLFPDIKVNGSDGPVTITPNDNLSVEVELGCGVYCGQNADWWVLADTPFGWYRYSVGGGWAPGQGVTHQGALFDLAPYEVLSMSGLPDGAYTIHFEVDLTMNGVKDTPIYSDSVEVTVTP